jgi:hypothetical protein
MVTMAPVLESMLTRVSSPEESVHNPIVSGPAWPGGSWQMLSPGIEAMTCHAAARTWSVRGAVALRWLARAAVRLSRAEIPGMAYTPIGYRRCLSDRN